MRDLDLKVNEIEEELEDLEGAKDALEDDYDEDVRLLKEKEKKKYCLVMGNEGNGVSEEIVERTCKMTGEEYTAFKDEKTGEYYCCIGETKELTVSIRG